MHPLLTDATRRLVELPERGLELSILDWGGDGPLALLHHANGFCAATWALVARTLRPHFRVVAFDARGHGESSAPPPGNAYAWIEFVHDWIALAERLIADGDGRAIGLAAGNSFGGLVTAYAAALRTDLVRRVAMLDPVLIPAPQAAAALAAQGVGPTPSRGNMLAEGARRRRNVFASREEALASWRGKPMFQRWKPEALALYVEAGLRDRPDGQVELACAREVEASVFDANLSIDLFSVAERLTAPTLLLYAELGHFSWPLFEALARRIPNARLEALPSDHLMPMHDPPELAPALIDFALG